MYVMVNVQVRVWTFGGSAFLGSQILVSFGFEDHMNPL
jgi:hypothetical protein